MSRLERELASLRAIGNYERVPGNKESKLPSTTVKTNLQTTLPYALYGKPLSAYGYDEAYELVLEAYQHSSPAEVATGLNLFHREWRCRYDKISPTENPCFENVQFTAAKGPPTEDLLNTVEEFHAALRIEKKRFPVNSPGNFSNVKKHWKQKAATFKMCYGGAKNQVEQDTSCSDFHASGEDRSEARKHKVPQIQSCCTVCGFEVKIPRGSAFRFLNHYGPTTRTLCKGSGREITVFTCLCLDCGQVKTVDFSGSHWHIRPHTTTLNNGYRLCTGSGRTVE